MKRFHWSFIETNFKILKGFRFSTERIRYALPSMQLKEFETKCKQRESGKAIDVGGRFLIYSSDFEVAGY